MLFSEHYGKELSIGNIAVYEAALADLEPDDLERCCRIALRQCRFMPTVADILAQQARDQKLLSTGECEREWATLLSYAHWENPWGETVIGETKRIEESGGVFRHVRVPGKPVSDEASHAVRCLGGYQVIQSTSPEHLPLLFKQFQEFYQNRKAQKESGFVLSDGEASEVLQQVKDHAKRLGSGGTHG